MGTQRTYNKRVQSRQEQPWRQLWILAACRFAEPFAIASMLPYLPQFLLHLGVEQSRIALHIGAICFLFNVCESALSMPVTMMSDGYGRKPAIITTLLVQALGNLGIGFCTREWQLALLVAIVASGNGGVAAMRVCVVEICESASSNISTMAEEEDAPSSSVDTTAKPGQKSQMQAKMFSVLPTAAGVASVLGPIVGGYAVTVVFMTDIPFLTPNLIAAMLFLPGIIGAVLFLQETKLDHRSPGRDDGFDGDAEEEISLLTVEPKHSTSDDTKSSDSTTVEVDPTTENPSSVNLRISWLSCLSNRYIWINAMIGLHSMGFDQLLSVLLQYPTVKQQQEDGRSTFFFASGFGMSVQTIGTLMTFAGLIGILTAFLGYPRLSRSFPHATILRYVLLLFPVVYIGLPFLAPIIPELRRAVLLIILLLVKASSSAAALQSVMILLSSVAVERGQVSATHGVNFAIASISRGIGTFGAGALFSIGVARNFILLPYCFLTICALVNILFNAITQ